MAENSRIEWTHHTFNPWRGCTKVSDGCKNCYAETLSGRNRKTLGVWGPNGTRVVASEAQWKLPLKWNREAACCCRKSTADHEHESGCPQQDRPRIFCASLADVFEDWQGHMHDSQGRRYWTDRGVIDSRPLPAPSAIPDDRFDGRLRWVTMQEIRARLFALIDATPNLDWLLLTKRPENIARMMPDPSGYETIRIRPNVWIGTSVENQATAGERIPHLLKVPAAVRFLSCEPLLGEVVFTHTWHPAGRPATAHGSEALRIMRDQGCGIDWVIVGGESGPGARPMHPDWARSIRDQCQAAGVPFFFKQWGEWAPLPTFHYTPAFGSGNREYVKAVSRYAREHGASMLLDDRPEGWDAYMIREGASPSSHTGWAIGKVGKKAAGRLLEGREWNEFPEVNHG